VGTRSVGRLDHCAAAIVERDSDAAQRLVSDRVFGVSTMGELAPTPLVHRRKYKSRPSKSRPWVNGCMLYSRAQKPYST
jgi:hypothetical protein